MWRHRQLVSAAGLLGTAILSLLSTAGAAAARDAKTPNIVFLLVDDLGWADIGCNGSDLHETPHIDQFAQQGMRFTDAYAAAPVCSPTRASILTGKSPARLHMTIWRESAKNHVLKRKLLPPDTVADLPHEEVTLAEALQAAGYVSAHVGKWHLGGFEHYPQTQGFAVTIGATGWGAPNTYWWPYSGSGSFGGEFRYVPHLEWGHRGEYLTDRLTSEAIQIIDRLKERPFFLYMCWHTVHTPIEGKPDSVKRFETRRTPAMHHQNATYAAMVATMDENVGRILNKLDDLGLRDNTIVILTSDNGGFINKHRGATVTSNFPLRSGKGSLYEGGIRVPLIVRWPPRIEAGAICGEPVISSDFFPTCLEVAGVENRARSVAAGDGLSLVPLFTNAAAHLDRRTLYWHYPHYYPTTSPVSAIRDGDWKLLHYYEDDRVELFNLAEDLGEAMDLATSRPDRARALRNKLTAWLDTVHAQLPRPNK